MNQSYNQLFDEKDILEDNMHQVVYKGSKKNTPHQRVIIHKFKKSNRMNAAFKDLLDSVIQNKLYIEENDEEIILVVKSIEGDNISLHLNFSEVSQKERIDYLYDYLHQATAYIGLDNYLLNILISSNQIVFVDNRLVLKENIIIDRRINDDIPFSIIAKNFGQVMQRLLITNYSELSTSKRYDQLNQFTESLVRREKQYQCFDELFTDFKKIYFEDKPKRKNILLGNAHPNNMFISSDSELLEEKTPEETPLNVESKDAHKETSVYETTLDELIDGLHSDRPTFTYEPIEETNQEAESETEFTHVTEEERAILLAPTEDEPVYGVPSYLKEEHVEDVKKKIKIDLRIPAIAAFVCMMMIFSILWIPPLFTPAAETAQGPEAKFSIEVQGDKIFCTNESIAYNDQFIAESYWVLLREGVEVISKPGKNKANFEVSGLAEGEYEIKLTVTDSLNRFSDPFIQEKEFLSPESKALDNQIDTETQLSNVQNFSPTTSEELLDEYPLSTTSNVTEDLSIFHNGNRAYKIDLSENDGSASLSFDSISIPAKSTISFWMMSNNAEPITMTILGYSNGENNLTKELVTNKGNVLTWSIVSLQMSLEKDTDRLVIRFNADDTILWFDDFIVRSFK